MTVLNTAGDVNTPLSQVSGIPEADLCSADLTASKISVGSRGFQPYGRVQNPPCRQGAERCWPTCYSSLLVVCAQLSVIQCNCAVRVLEALAPLAPEYVNDKLVILTVREQFCRMTGVGWQTPSCQPKSIRVCHSRINSGITSGIGLRMREAQMRGTSVVTPGADAEPAGQGACQHGGRHRAAAGADRREAQRQVRQSLDLSTDRTISG